ncbi:MAG: stage sporulation protein [Epulopiscium sp.]|jgi:stage III sporulation protein AG|uniref:Stage III sporulation protein AG n=1 Tax=Defluviitalea raffinosedens TaxID=1450156 RepID=A0A7C8HGH6_9FIRM|nr:stage III sporulation protein AG [Defluviitalea raffinosedens]MBZ4668537.1 hypothetical protein [Defluviitaleaceae bacterium]MDK2788697.1 stage sporulation protein [Candidatus Epulonipiscium sp.]KAE9637230.1 stage III sporulation protein AG [Defluviitalea raffinosedens]MBM7685531.1 stage III sporulation protein AG [Defluviitalea raffinosedens]HHW66740.1 stage III sporulation protein AG [Candidatus Epulonipiscium sp.]
MEKIKEWLKSLHKENKKIISNILFLTGMGILFIVLGNTIFTDIPKTISRMQNKSSNTSRIINETNQSYEENKSYEEIMEERIENIFSKMEGVGKVKVMITISYGREVHIAEDVNSTYSITNEEDQQGGRREVKNEDVQSKIVMQSTGSGSTQPIVLKEKQPEIQGILILAEGGDDPRIKQQLTAASETLLGVPAHKVQVFKMNNK